MKQQLKGSNDLDSLMEGINLSRAIRWFPLLHIMVLISGTITSFSVAYSKHDISIYLPFISETGAYSPAMNIFSLSLILGSFIGSCIIFFRYAILHINYLENDRLFNICNTSSFIIGIIAMIGLAGVAAFPMTSVFWLHLLFAGMYFLGSALYFLGSTIITLKLFGITPIFILRLILTATIFVLLFFLVICFPVALHNWYKSNNKIPALKKPSDEGFTLILISSILEWSTVGIILFYNVSLMKELKENSVIIKSNTDQSKPQTEVPIAVPEDI